MRIGVKSVGGSALVRDNLFWQNQANGGGTGGGLRVDGDLIEVTGNTFHACTQTIDAVGGAALRLQGGAVTFDNNVISECTGAQAVWLSSGTMDTDCNLYWGNTDGDVEGFAMGPFDRVEDPSFCDASSGDFTVRSASPCLPPNSLGCDLIGARGQGCGSVALPGKSWGQIKGAYR